MDLATIQIKVDTREVKAANDDIGKLGRTGTRVSKDVNAANDSMAKSTGRVSAAYKALGGVMAALGVGALVNSFANTVTATERLRASLVTVTGSTENAAFAFDQLLQFANTTPFTLDQSVQGFTKLVALGLDPSERALKSYGNTAAGMGFDLNKMIEAVADASTMEFERLKDFGIRASQQADQITFEFAGVTTTVGKNAQEIQEYLLGIGETNFAGAMEDQMARLPGMLSMLSDNVTKFFLAIGDAGGINAFGAAISAASTAMVFATENLDILGTAFYAAAAAAAVAFGPTMILAAISAVQTAVIGLYTVIAANPFAALAMALGAAAVVMIRHWDAIKVAAQKAAINIQIGWNKLMLFLMNAFAPVLSSITDLFKDIQRQAIATWTAVKAATMDPLNAIETFNSTFDETLDALEQGDQSAGVFANQIGNTRNRIEELYGELETLNAETELADDNFVEAERSLSDFQVQIDETAVAAAAAEVEMEAMRTKALDVIRTIENEQEALHLSNLELEIRNNLQKAGVDATSELGQQIIAATTELHNEKAAMDAASIAADELAKANEAAQKKIEEDTKKTHEQISGFFVDLFSNGKSAFDNLVDSFKSMLIKMAAELAASQVMKFLGGGSMGNIGSTVASVLGGGGGTVSAASSAGIGATVAATLNAAGATIGSAASNALAFITGPVGIATLAAGAAAALLDKGGTPTTAAGITMAKTPGMSEGNVFQTSPFESGFAPLGFKQNATNQQAEAAIQPLREIDATLTALTKEAGLNVNLSGHTFSGVGVEGTGAGTLLGTFIEEGKVKGTSMEDQMGMYAAEWVNAVGARNNIPQSELNRIIGDGSAAGILERTAMELEAIKLAQIDGSHENGLAEVPYDGYVAELHAGERVLTAQQAAQADSMAMDIASLRGSIEEIMIAVARNTAKSYRLYDRWDKNGLPPTRA